MSKKILTALLAISIVLSLSACGGDEASSSSVGTESKAEQTSNVSVADESESNGSVGEASAEESSEARQETVTFETVNTEEPEYTDLKASAKAGSSTAKAIFQARYRDDDFEVVLFADDAEILSGDALEFVLGSSSASATFENGKFIKVVATADGNVVANIFSGKDFSKAAEGVVSKAEGWDCESGKGYVITVNVPYSQIDTEFDAAYGKLAFAPGIINASAGSEAATAYVTDYSCDPSSACSLINIVDDDSYEANRFAGVVNLGASYFNYQYDPNAWDLTADYPETDSDYANRKVLLTGTGVQSIYFSRVHDTTLYAEAEFKLQSISLDDAWPKFGFAFFDEEYNGIFTFIDCATNDSNATEISDIQNKFAGYCNVNAGTYSWEGGSQIDYDMPLDIDYSQKIKVGVYRSGSTFKLLVNDQVVKVITDCPTISADVPLQAAINAFNLQLELTSYRCTNDPEDPMIQLLAD